MSEWQADSASVSSRGSASALVPGPAPLAAKRRRRLKSRHWVHLATCFFSILTSIWMVSAFGTEGAAGNIIWIANGMLFAYLLLAPRWLWPAYLVAGLAGMALGSFLIHESWRINLLFNCLDVVEILTGALLLRPRSTILPRFTNGPYLLRFLAFAVLGGPLLSAALCALIQHLLWNVAPLPLFGSWLSADSLGIAVTCPIFVAIFQSDGEDSHNLRKNWGYLALLVAVTLVVFWQVQAPVLFFIFPALILVLLRLGLGWAAAASLFVAFAGGWFTLKGLGPFAISQHLSISQRCTLIQVFIATLVFTLYCVSVVLESRRVIERRLEKTARLHALVSENSRDAIMVADLYGNRSYVSAAVERLTGWTSAQFAALKSLDLVHPDDRSMAIATVEGLAKGREGAVVECRVRKSSGEYLWIEASLRLLRDEKTGAPNGILNVVRDVTERKLAEQKLQEAYRAVEALASTDALTGVANRRQFEQRLNNEWRRSLREQRSLSILMIDADHFKAFNDTYGHTKGDGCLKQIAEAAQDIAARPGDVVARFGGEEFAVILPNTDNAGAGQLAFDICESMRHRQLPHEGNPWGIVTVSIGYATAVPAFGQTRIDLVEMADRALYAAKHAGRNCACNGNELPGKPTETPSSQSLAASIGKSA